MPRFMTAAGLGPVCDRCRQRRTAASPSIGDCSERDARAVVDCTGLALAPGFIDVHSHSDELWLVDGRALGKIAQGVTTEIGGNCGTSVAPLPAMRTSAKRATREPYRLDVDWHDFDGFFAAVEHSGVACNVASLVGLGTTRAASAARRAPPRARASSTQQTRLVREAVEQGALGVSSGLIYEPSRYADLAELVACAGAARAAGAPRYVSHVRDEGDALSKRSTRRWRSGRRRRRGAVLASQSGGPAQLGQGAPHAGDARPCARTRRRRRGRRLPVRCELDRSSRRSCPMPCAAAVKRRRSSGCATRRSPRRPQCCSHGTRSGHRRRQLARHPHHRHRVGPQRRVAGLRLDEVAAHWRRSRPRAPRSACSSRKSCASSAPSSRCPKTTSRRS